jgi:hypothetical protein
MKRTERPFNSLPRPLVACFLLILVVQIWTAQGALSAGELAYKPLPDPTVSSTYRVASMGSDRLLSYLLAIRLQLHDNQSGKHMRYEQLDYQKLTHWLEQITALNPHSEYPTMLASRVYSQTSDKQNMRLMIDFIQASFTRDPQLHWRRMTEATILAKHKLGDLSLALLLAEQLTTQPLDVVMPQWARDMQFILLGELNEFETGIAIIVAMLESGSLKNADERRFLRVKLLEFQQKLLESQQ